MSDKPARPQRRQVRRPLPGAFVLPALACLLGIGATGCRTRPLVVVIPPEQYVIVDAPPAPPAPGPPAVVEPPSPEPELETEEGLASWYGSKFHGSMTASGEAFNMAALTAAHRKLPFGSLVRVVNLANQLTVDVRINDRGPVKEDRIIDLSWGAAQRIDLVRAGLATVRLYVLRRGYPKDQALSDAADAAPVTRP